MRKSRPLTAEEKLYNEEAIRFLDKKGLTAKEIKLFQWNWVKWDEGIIKIPRGKSKVTGVIFYRTFPFLGSPLEVVLARGVWSKPFVFTTCYPSSGIFPYEDQYTEEQIAKICGKLEEKSIIKCLRIPLPFGIIELSRTSEH